MKNVSRVSPQEAEAMVRDGATLVDIREAAECDRVIPQAQHAPLSSLAPGSVLVDLGQPVIFYCRSGRRTAMNVDQLSASTPATSIYLLDGGFDA
jgi:rhodanese-related sulfurtransferase